MYQTSCAVDKRLGDVNRVDSVPHRGKGYTGPLLTDGRREFGPLDLHGDVAVVLAMLNVDSEQFLGSSRFRSELVLGKFLERRAAVVPRVL